MTRGARRRVQAAFCLLTLCLAGLANHGPGTSGGGTSTVSGETLRQGAFEISVRSDATLFEHFGRSEAELHALQSGEFDALDRSLVETLSLAYGVTDDFQVGAQMGYYFGRGFIAAEDNGLGGADSATADPEGLTDLWLTGKLRLMRGASGHVALLGGVKLPTGKDDERLSDGTLLEPSSQPGSGAVDFQLGAAWSRYLTSRWTIDASGVYTLRGEHDDFEVGDRADLGVALAYRLTESIRTYPNWSVSAELLGVWLDKDQESGVDNPNSGGSAVYFAPGVRARFDEHLSLSVAPAVPVLQDLNGDQPETRGKLAVSLSYGF
jgi:outer membrane putative beta-barrel porin/alpha-amylase